MFEVSVEILALLLLAAVLSGFVDAIAGGGGLITVPALMLAGAAPVEALATNKLQGSFGTATAALSYARAGHVDLRRQLVPALLAACASGLGAFAVHFVPVVWLGRLMPVVLIGVALFFALRRGLSDESRPARLQPALITAFFVPLVGAYDGFFGPGTGSFFMLGFVLLGGYGLLRATAQTKFLNFASSFAALLVFLPMGGIWWGTGLVMAGGQILGARLGAKLAMRRGARLIRPLLVVTSGGMALRLIWQSFG